MLGLVLVSMELLCLACATSHAAPTTPYTRSLYFCTVLGYTALLLNITLMTLMHLGATDTAHTTLALVLALLVLGIVGVLRFQDPLPSTVYLFGVPAVLLVSMFAPFWLFPYSWATLALLLLLVLGFFLYIRALHRKGSHTVST